MPADRLLGTLLRALQPHSGPQDVNRLLGTSVSLLTTLNNPLNVVLLTSQVLSAPAIWSEPDLERSLKCMSVFHSASQALVKHERAKKSRSPDRDFAALQLERALPQDEWIRAVVKGADEHSPRWRHILVLAGMLLGFGPREDAVLSRAMRSTLEKSLTNAVNLACEETPEDDMLVLMRASFRAQAGLASPRLLGAIDQDVSLSTHNRLRWPEQSTSFQYVRTLLANPLVASLGSLARLIAHGIDQVQDPGTIMAVLDDLDDYSRILHQQWRQNKLSTVEVADEGMILDAETLHTTFPALWKLYRGIMFASTLILRAITGRLLGDKTLAQNSVAPDVAIQTLRVVRHTYFISARAGPSTFSQHKFVHLTAIDILATHPLLTRDFLYSIKPTDLGHLPQHPIDRNLDLFFLNTAEYFTPMADTDTAGTLFLPAATPYITSNGDANMLPVFEAAHSVILATFAAPQNADLANVHLPFYVGALFGVFPSSLPVRQFRYALNALMMISTPPSRLAAKQPMLSSTLLELLRERAERASTTPLPPHILGGNEAPQTVEAPPDASPGLSEQAVVVLTVIDTLTQLPLDLLDEWLPITADMINLVDDRFMREECKQHFWHILNDGGMDPQRSRVSHAWWSTAGGREAVLYGRDYPDPHMPEMSGALPEDPARL
ncbi:hypothetical protein AMS68_005476 [Peltaster fructicola]|uniref:Peroxisomal membrane protein PEX17 n=1 Tax=Peltaster fructicola TaxID=286661 RepID=A0A6H0XZB7_9PEZI|nr:hypothetical protein AMS68_005476 [Peltaster fructicola]